MKDKKLDLDYLADMLAIATAPTQGQTKNWDYHPNAPATDMLKLPRRMKSMGRVQLSEIKTFLRGQTRHHSRFMALLLMIPCDPPSMMRMQKVATLQQEQQMTNVYVCETEEGAQAKLYLIPAPMVAEISHELLVLFQTPLASPPPMFAWGLLSAPNNLNMNPIGMASIDGPLRLMMQMQLGGGLPRPDSSMMGADAFAMAGGVPSDDSAMQMQAMLGLHGSLPAGMNAADQMMMAPSHGADAYAPFDPSWMPASGVNSSPDSAATNGQASIKPPGTADTAHIHPDRMAQMAWASSSDNDQHSNAPSAPAPSVSSAVNRASSASPDRQSRAHTRQSSRSSSTSPNRSHSKSPAKSSKRPVRKPNRRSRSSSSTLRSQSSASESSESDSRRKQKKSRKSSPKRSRKQKRKASPSESDSSRSRKRQPRRGDDEKKRSKKSKHRRRDEDRDSDRSSTPPPASSSAKKAKPAAAIPGPAPIAVAAVPPVEPPAGSDRFVPNLSSVVAPMVTATAPGPVSVAVVPAAPYSAPVPVAVPAAAPAASAPQNRIDFIVAQAPNSFSSYSLKALGAVSGGAQQLQAVQVRVSLSSS